MRRSINGRKVKYQNPRIPLDLGCSHSILHKKYSNNKLKENNLKKIRVVVTVLPYIVFIR